MQINRAVVVRGLACRAKRCFGDFSLVVFQWLALPLTALESQFRQGLRL
jgi:hypothetical protein